MKSCGLELNCGHEGPSLSGQLPVYPDMILRRNWALIHRTVGTSGTSTEAT